MNIRQSLNSAFAGLLSLLILPAVSAADLPEDGLTTHKHDPFLASMRIALDKRLPSQDDLEKISAYIKQHPEDPFGHMVLATAYNKLGMDGMYAESLEQAWSLSPSSLLYLVNSLRARALTDDHPNYERLINKAYHTYYNNAEMLNKLGQIFLGSKQNVFAVRFLKRALELDPDNIELRCNYADSLLSMKRFKDLLVVTTPLLSNSRTKSMAHLLMGISWFNLKQAERALPLLADAYQESPRQPAIAEAYLDCLLATGRSSEALLPALMTIALQPPFDPHLRVVKAKVKPIISNATTSTLENGIAHVKEAIPGGRPLALFYFALGDLLDRSGRVLHAGNCFNEGLLLDDTIGRAYMRLAYDKEVLGYPAEQVLKLYNEAALKSHDDKEVIAKYERMKARMPALNKDIAGKIKFAFNNIRYRT